MGMNREGAETYLRLLAEAELYGPALPPARWRSGPGAGTARISRVAQALTAVDAWPISTLRWPSGKSPAGSR
jgi:hypothetical protein